MSTHALEQVAQAMVAPGKGILAADESTGTIQKRFEGIKVECTEDNRRAYRDLLFTTQGLGEFVSGVILYDETLRQKAVAGTPFVDVLAKNGILPGIKVDTGAKDLALCPGETVTEGLDGLAKRCADYVKLGAKFAKWRAVITIGDGIPSTTCIAANVHALARYAAICQATGLVPIVEPEVLMDGAHDIGRCEAVTEWTLNALYAALTGHRVVLEATVLKPSMVIAGKTCPQQAGVDEVAERTVRVLRRCVPAAVAGVVFLSGGQSDELATAHLNAMNAQHKDRLPWPLSFSYGRALQQPALKAWKGQPANIAAAQRALHHRARMNGLACTGRYRSEMEKQALAA
ncbi:MAG: class I fructose-bisphosphate aldolase [Burkholderiales bacterium]